VEWVAALLWNQWQHSTGIRMLGKLRDALLPKLMSGELRVA